MITRRRFFASPFALAALGFGAPIGTAAALLPSRREITVNIVCDLLADETFVEKELIPALGRAISRDAVIVPPNTRQNF